jgi:hypothetical protein
MKYQIFSLTLVCLISAASFLWALDPNGAVTKRSGVSNMKCTETAVSQCKGCKSISGGAYYIEVLTYDDYICVNATGETCNQSTEAKPCNWNSVPAYRDSNCKNWMANVTIPEENRPTYFWCQP